MLARMQRIVAGIEIFALVFWVGGLFFLVAFVPPVLEHALAETPDKAWEATSSFVSQFGSVELIFAAIVLISNFLKLMVFRGIAPLQRIALMISAMMILFTGTSLFAVRPALEDKRAALGTLAVAPGHPETPERAEFEELRRQQEFLLFLNWGLGLFLVYSYRSFEERKLQALARIIKMP